MLPLPKNLDISRDSEEEASLLAKAREYLERYDRKGLHLSDLIDPLLSYHKKKSGNKIPDRLVNMFLVGQVAHTIVEIIKGGEAGDYTKSDSGTKHSEDIYYSPDFMNFKGEPDEIKTTRSFYPPKVAYLPDDQTFHMYFEQLLGYMALEDKAVGRLTMLYLNMKDENHKTAPQFYVWKIETTPEALAAYRKVLLNTKATLATALESGDPSALPLCRKWKCRDCEFFNTTCQPIGRHGLAEKYWER